MPASTSLAFRTPLLWPHTHVCSSRITMYSEKFEQSFYAILPRHFKQHARLIIISSQLVVFAMLLREAQGVDQPSLSFQFPLFDNPSIANFRFVKEDSWYTGDNVQSSNNTVWLTPDPNAEDTKAGVAIGKMVYEAKITFKTRDHGSASFSTWFTFQIITTEPYGENGSGMVFFIADYDKAPPASYGRYLGMVSEVNPTSNHSFFAIEFDTRLSSNLHDVSSSHIGIDINSLVSRNVRDTSPYSTDPEFYPELYLYNNYTFSTWVEYNSSTNLIQVWMTNSSTSQRPLKPCLTLEYNLSTIFRDTMYVGFSASNKRIEDGMQGHALYSWNFTTNFPAHPKRSASNHKLVVVIAYHVVVVVGILCFCACFCLWKRIKRHICLLSTTIWTHRDNIAVEYLPSVPLYTLKQLRKATNKFSNKNKIGEGGFSFVYRGVLEDGSMVAVKRLKDSLKERKQQEFLTELKVISSTVHRNLLRLKGWCYERKEAILVYDYMSKGSLNQYLYGEEIRGWLPQDARLRILAGVATALEYLHFGLEKRVLHRDVKAANVLLTDELEPVLGDFGLARPVSHTQADPMTMTAAVGTTGYIAPEVIYSRKFSDKSDVYGFGVLALEVACGRRAIDMSHPNPNAVYLAEWVQNLHLSNSSTEALDSSMRHGMSPHQVEQWVAILHLGLMCCNPAPEARPNMMQICQTLKGDNALLPQTLPTPRSWARPALVENWPSAPQTSASG